MNNDQRAESEKGPRQVLEVFCGETGVCGNLLAVRLLWKEGREQRSTK